MYSLVIFSAPRSLKSEKERPWMQVDFSYAIHLKSWVLLHAFRKWNVKCNVFYDRKRRTRVGRMQIKTLLRTYNLKTMNTFFSLRNDFSNFNVFIIELQFNKQIKFVYFPLPRSIKLQVSFSVQEFKKKKHKSSRWLMHVRTYAFARRKNSITEVSTPQQGNFSSVRASSKSPAPDKVLMYDLGWNIRHLRPPL